MSEQVKAPDPITQNIESIAAFYKREHKKVKLSQWAVERISDLVGTTTFLGCIVLFVTLWILVNVGARQMHMVEFDPPPFFWLQGIVSLLAMLIATAVLIRQGRFANLEERREQLDLQVNLLTEQKTTKVIKLLEELRRDLPMVKDRHDPELEAMQQRTDPQRVLTEMDEAHAKAEREKQHRETLAAPDSP